MVHRWEDPESFKVHFEEGQKVEYQDRDINKCKYVTVVGTVTQVRLTPNGYLYWVRRDDRKELYHGYENLSPLRKEALAPIFPVEAKIRFEELMSLQGRMADVQRCRVLTALENMQRDVNREDPTSSI